MANSHLRNMEKTTYENKFKGKWFTEISNKDLTQINNPFNEAVIYLICQKRNNLVGNPIYVEEYNYLVNLAERLWKYTVAFTNE